MSRVWRFILAPWWALCRQIDIWVLWPECKRAADDPDHAIGAFMWHCCNDPAWRDMTDEQVNRIVRELR